jgi:archaellin
MDKKALGHTTLIIFLSVLIAAIIASASIIAGTYTFHKGIFQKFSGDQEKLVTNIDIVRIFADGTIDGVIGPGDNVTILGRVLDGSGAVDLKEITLTFDGAQLLDAKEFRYSPTLGVNNSFTIFYYAKGHAFRQGYVSPGDVVGLKTQLPVGVSYKEVDRMFLSIGLSAQGKIIPITITLPASMSTTVSVIYPFS